MTRQAVEQFAEAMEDKLKKNDYKGGWHSCQCTKDFLRQKLMEEVIEYLHGYGTDELPDIANMAMMLWHREKRTGITK